MTAFEIFIQSFLYFQLSYFVEEKMRLNEYGVIAQTVVFGMNEVLLVEVVSSRRHPYPVRSSALRLLLLLLLNAFKPHHHSFSPAGGNNAARIMPVILNEEKLDGNHYHHHHPGKREFIVDSAMYVTALSGGIPRKLLSRSASSSAEFSKAIRLGIARGLLSNDGECG